MTKLLASVMSVEEARIALDCGADLIDFKDPTTGALGALPDAVIREGVRIIASRRPTSATIGDVPMIPEVLARRVQQITGCGVDYVKVGFFPSPNARACTAALAQFARHTRLVAVLFADLALDLDWLAEFAGAGFAGVMLDTADKNSANLRRHMDDTKLSAFVLQAKGRGMIAGLAGSLGAGDIPDLLNIGPDYLGFRGALCAGGRSGALAPEKVIALRERIRGDYSASRGLRTARPPRFRTCV